MIKIKNANKEVPCPCGNGTVKESPKAWNCSCYKTIWKTYFKKKLTQNQALKLLSGETLKLKGFKTNKGRSFDGMLKFDDNTKNVELNEPCIEKENSLVTSMKKIMDSLSKEFDKPYDELDDMTSKNQLYTYEQVISFAKQCVKKGLEPNLTILEAFVIKNKIDSKFKLLDYKKAKSMKIDPVKHLFDTANKTKK